MVLCLLCEVVIGVGSAVGTAMGGMLYEAGGRTLLGSWRLPFIVSAAGPLALLPLLPALPGKTKEGNTVSDASATAGDGDGEGVSGPDAPAASLLSVCTAPRVLALASLFFGSAMIEATSPILQPYASAPPLSLSNGRIGLIVATFSLAYMLGALPVGALTDRIVEGPQPPVGRIKAVVLSGWLGLALSYALLGPLSSVSPTGTLVASMALGGAFAAAIVIPSLPELQLGVGDADEPAKAALCSLWNGVYSGGAGVGPLVTSSIFGARGFRTSVRVLLASSCAFAGLLAAAAATLALRTGGARRGPLSRGLGRASRAATVTARALLLRLRRPTRTDTRCGHAAGLERPFLDRLHANSPGPEPRRGDRAAPQLSSLRHATGNEVGDRTQGDCSGVCTFY